jgi:hypothetical protein
MPSRTPQLPATPVRPAFVAALVAGLLLLLGGCRGQSAPRRGAGAAPPQAKRVPPCADLGGRPIAGRIATDVRWCGAVHVVGNILVARGATLTIDPGTRVLFKPYRGYRDPTRRLSLRVEGRLIARGLPGALIRFGSEDLGARNGDWAQVRLVNARGSVIAYAVFEYAQHGLNIWGTDLELDHVVVRFNNWEGIYVESPCRVRVTKSRIYANGYNCIAVEQRVDLRVEESYIASCGTAGIHVDDSTAVVERSLIEGSREGLSLDNDATAGAVRNRFTGQAITAVSCGEGKNRLRLEGNVIDGLPDRAAIGCDGAEVVPARPGESPAAPLLLGLDEGEGVFLPYIPGDRARDPYPYVYPDSDETREVTAKVGAGLGLLWSVEWDSRSRTLFAANLDGQVYRLDPASGKVLARFAAPGPQPWGLALGDELLYVNDFARRRIYGLDPKTGAVRREFAAPDPAGGCKGLAFDGRHLYALGWATARLYELASDGRVLSSVRAPSREIGGGVRLTVSGGLTWDGEAFWAPSDRLYRFDRTGKILGWIHSTSERVWDLAWDGTGLWTTQRANENWADFPRLFRVKVKKLRTD